MEEGLDAENFDPKEYLRQYCRLTDEMEGAGETYQPQLEIDYLRIEPRLAEFRGIQEKACEQIVDVVDGHLDTFTDISSRLLRLTEKLAQTEKLYGGIMEKVETNKKEALTAESRLQQFVEAYESAELESTLLEQADEAVSVLVACNDQLEGLRKSSTLTVRRKHTFLKFSWKLSTIRRILSHSLVVSRIREFDQIQLVKELETDFVNCMAEHLITCISQGATLQQTQETIGQCFRYLNRREQYYATIEEHLVLRQLRAVEANFLSNKSLIMSNHDQPRVQSFFGSLFGMIKQLPADYPHERIVKLLTSFLAKKEFNFLYTYTLPLFPNAYSTFKAQLQQLDNRELKEELGRSHKWNIKVWADVRVQELSKSNRHNDDLLAQLANIFQKNCLIEGVKSKMVRTALLTIARYCGVARGLKTTPDDYAATLNKLVAYSHEVPDKLKEYVSLAYPANDAAERLASECTDRWRKCIDEFLSNHLQLIVTGCINSLESVNSILTKIVAAGGALVQIHKPASVFKLMHSHIRSNSTLSPESQKVIGAYLTEELKKGYAQLKGDVADYSARTLTNEQVKWVASALEQDSRRLFEHAQV